MCIMILFFLFKIIDKELKLLKTQANNKYEIDNLSSRLYHQL